MFLYHELVSFKILDFRVIKKRQYIIPVLMQYPENFQAINILNDKILTRNMIKLSTIRDVEV